jgi:hypothetical protein
LGRRRRRLSGLISCTRCRSLASAVCSAAESRHCSNPGSCSSRVPASDSACCRRGPAAQAPYSGLRHCGCCNSSQRNCSSRVSAAAAGFRMMLTASEASSASVLCQVPRGMNSTEPGFISTQSNCTSHQSGKRPLTCRYRSSQGASPGEYCMPVG